MGDRRLALFQRQADTGGVHVQEERLQILVNRDRLDELWVGFGTVHVVGHDEPAGPHKRLQLAQIVEIALLICVEEEQIY